MTNPLNPPDGEPLDPTEGDELYKLLKRYGNTGDFKVRVFRIAANKDNYLFSSDGPVDEDFIQQEHGGGTYKLKFFVNEEYRDSVTLYIADPPNQAARLPAVAPSAAANPNPPGALFGPEFLQTLVLTLIENRSSGGGSDLSQLTGALRNLDEMRGGATKAVDPLDMFFKGWKARGELVGDSGEPKKDFMTQLTELAKDVVPVLMPGRPGASTPEANPKEAATMSQVIQHGLAAVKREAAAGRDPDLVVDWVLNHADDPSYQPFIRLALESPFEAIGQYDPELAQPPLDGWFRKVYDGIRSAYSEADIVAMDPARSSGDAGDTGDDEAARDSGDEPGSSSRAG